MGTVLTEDYVLARSGSYEQCSVFHLDLSNSKLTSVGRILKSCPHLQRLDLSGNLQDSLSFLEDLAELQWLSVCGNSHIGSVETQVGCLSLDTLFIEGTNIHWEDFIEQFRSGKLGSLRRLALQARPTGNNQTATTAFSQAVGQFKEAPWLQYCNGYHRDEVAFLSNCTEQADSLLVDELTNESVSLSAQPTLSVPTSASGQSDLPRLNARIATLNNNAQNQQRDLAEATRRYG